MFKNYILIPFLQLFVGIIHAQMPKPPDSLRTPFEIGRGLQTATHAEGIAFYDKLSRTFPKWLRFETRGSTDCGVPLHLLVVADDAMRASPQYAAKKNKCIWLINNAIHAGEPDGVDASMLFIRDLMLDSVNRKRVLENAIILILPFYNVDGALNRNSTTRTNQNGPESYGFRGNGKNLDLNRDFTKADTKNTRSFLQIYNQWMPDLLLDTHVSNGADYQYTMTLLPTQSDKLHPLLARFQQDTILPFLYDKMKLHGNEMCPYINFEETPDKGITGFLDLPRYSTGFAALHHAYGFMSETHMLKPFKDRVAATRLLMHTFCELIDNQFVNICATRKQAIQESIAQKQFDIQWKLDTSKRKSLIFKGYEAKYKQSQVTNLPQLWYDKKTPYTKSIPYFPHFKPTLNIQKPVAYILPRAYAEVAERLQINGVRIELLEEDDTLDVEMYYIRDFKTTSFPYEGHYLHSQVQVEPVRMKRRFRKGDYRIRMNQAANRLITEMLEPQASDSYFCWNFFDGILMQKEGYSDYVFEPLAAEILKKNPDLKRKLDEKRTKEPEFARSGAAQLDFIYKNSPYYEVTHQLYPVGRVLN
jgi:Zinc carboxypeptidase